jgi:diguanylate cyclase (GGDEF)-like protein
MGDVTADLLPCAVIVVDPEDRIREANALFVEWTRSAVDDLRGAPLSRFLLDPRTEWSGPEDVPYEPLPVLTDGNGIRRPVVLSRRDTEDGAILTLVDATERVAYEAQLRGRRALEERTRVRLQLIIDASIAFSAAESERELAEILAVTVAQAYRAEESAVYLVNEVGAYTLAAGADPFSEVLDTSGLVTAAVRRGTVIKITDAEGAAELDPGLGDAMRATGVQAIIVAPLKHDDLSLGIFACFFHHPRQFDAEAAPLADALAGQAAQVATTLRLQRRLRYAATHDDTTGLPNRRFLEERSARYAESTSPLAAIFIDLDGFKRVNDDLGHHTGDHLLREVGRRLRSALREDDVVVRYGGDEFIVVCEVPDVSGARDVAERLRRNLATPFDFLPPEFKVGASLGISIASPADGPVQIDTLVRAADQAMYRAKAAGGHRIVVDRGYDVPALTATAPTLQPTDLAAALDGAVVRGEISAWFQPQIDVRTGAIVAAEALSRWNHPELGAIGPGTFIPVAEDAGLIVEIGSFMAEQCVAALERWSTPERPIDVSLNVSPLQLLDSEFADWLAEVIARRPFDSGRLTIEITESRPIADIDAVLGRLARLRTLGVGVAIDDFGAGHASLDQLKRLHGSEIKLDRSLVSDLSPRATEEMANAIAVARASGIRVVAEGVESEQHLDRVIRLGCDRAQGFLISRPLPADRMTAALAAGPLAWRDLALG